MVINYTAFWCFFQNFFILDFYSKFFKRKNWLPLFYNSEEAFLFLFQLFSFSLTLMYRGSLSDSTCPKLYAISLISPISISKSDSCVYLITIRNSFWKSKNLLLYKRVFAGSLSNSSWEIGWVSTSSSNIWQTPAFSYIFVL